MSRLTIGFAQPVLDAVEDRSEKTGMSKADIIKHSVAVQLGVIEE